jgi:hypothetical protein
MKCPNCGYITGYEWNEDGGYEDVKGEAGEFYRLPIKLEREEPYSQPESAQVRGCPVCKVLFMVD